MSGGVLMQPVASLAEAVRTGEIRSAELLDASEAALKSADAGDDPVHALLCTTYDRAHRRLSGAAPTGPLAGVPVVVKDNLCTADLPTTCGSRLLVGYRSPYDATVVCRLADAGALLVGKSNLDEFAMGSSTEHSAFGPTRNPLDRSRVPGGSSGGSAAAVAAGVVPVALGSETGGSVRQPAAFCGVVGIKPTYGRVSRYGLVGFASSLDQVGVLGRRVEDAVLALRVIAGHDPRDPSSAPAPAPRWSREGPDGDGVEGMVVGVPAEYLPDSLDPGVGAAFAHAVRRLRELGVEIRELSLPSTALAVPAYHVIATAEASTNLARFDGVRFGVRPPDVLGIDELYERTRALMGPEVKRRILLGTHVLSAGHRDQYYGLAQRVRDRITRDFREAFAGGLDALFTPTTPTTAFRLGERLGDPYSMYLADVFTVPASLAGVPALSLPIGRVGGLPVGGQLIGDHWREGRIFRLARALERALSDHAS